MIRLLILFIALSLSSCSSLELRNLGKSGASAGIAYAINPLAGVATLATAMAYDEIVPDSPEVADIETKEQAVAFVATSWGKDALYGFLAFLLVTNIVVPWLTKRRGYNQAKQKYKE
ncbi:MAG: hypothetical protein HN669_04945 [Candidatus Marinimicrobia bacterium]|jgi:hypothetical protein|nr:hypothetical protein [Candidatus Neomarinimicrobiota bacterium]